MIATTTFLYVARVAGTLYTLEADTHRAHVDQFQCGVACDSHPDCGGYIWDLSMVIHKFINKYRYHPITGPFNDIANAPQDKRCLYVVKSTLPGAVRSTRTKAFRLSSHQNVLVIEHPNHRMPVTPKWVLILFTNRVSVRKIDFQSPQNSFKMIIEWQ